MSSSQHPLLCARGFPHLHPQLLAPGWDRAEACVCTVPAGLDFSAPKAGSSPGLATFFPVALSFSPPSVLSLLRCSLLLNAYLRVSFWGGPSKTVKTSSQVCLTPNPVILVTE